MKYRGREITIENFGEAVPYEQLELVMGKAHTKRFMKWMYGQTCPIGGVYSSDLERWLKGLPVLDW